VVSKEQWPEGRLLRLVLGPEGQPFVDLQSRAGGRGVYVRADSLAEALAPKVLGKTFRGRAKVLASPEIEAVLKATRQALDQRLFELCGLARRAAKVELGVDAVVEGLAEGGGPVVVVIADDLSARSLERVEEAMARRAGGVTRIPLGTQNELGRAVGRDRLGVLLVSDERFRSRLECEAERRSGLRITSLDDSRKSH
jgi:predicted RNA-binding protein YlxR (DUF448 family)